MFKPKLLTINQTKLLKSKSLGYLTAGLQLLSRTKHTCLTALSLGLSCTKTCLASCGRNRFGYRAQKARLNMLRFNPDYFRACLILDLSRLSIAAAKEGLKPACRLNITSDIDWFKTNPWIFECFPHVQFYDYTKDWDLWNRYIRGELPTNLYLTFSYHERLTNNQIRAILRQGTLACVFIGEKPKSWYSQPVIDGDIHDLRFLDKPGSIVGLKYKLSWSDKTKKMVRPNPRSNPGFIFNTMEE